MSTPTIQFKMALYIAEAVLRVVVKTFLTKEFGVIISFLIEGSDKHSYHGSEQLNRYAVV